MALPLEVARPQHHALHPPRRDEGGRRPQPRRSAPARRWRWWANWAAASRCRRSPSCACCPTRRPASSAAAVRLNGRDIVAAARGGHARHQGQGDRHDLPGPDELAQSGGDDREADRRGADHPHRARPRPGTRPRARAAGTGRHARRRAPARRLSAPAFGRHVPAGGDRHGDRLQPLGADRRRADHGARRHGAGAGARRSSRSSRPMPAWR